MGSRRRFLRDLALGLPLTCLAPSLLWSCRKSSLLFSSSHWKGDLAVVGAGVAGLQAALIAQSHGANVVLYEADKEVGGRVLSQGPSILPQDPPTKGAFSEFPIELGADLILDPQSALYRYMQSHLVEITPYEEIQAHFIGNTLYKGSALANHLVYRTYEQIKATILGETQQGNQSLNDYIDALAARDGLSDDEKKQHKDAKLVFESRLNARYHLTTSQVSIDQYQKMAQSGLSAQARAYTGNYTLSSILRYSYIALERYVQKRTEITRIDYAGERVRLYDAHGDLYEADKVIITVGIDALKRMQFLPTLPEEKASVLNQSYLAPCTKIMLKFSRPFWNNAGRDLFFPSDYAHALAHPHGSILMLYAYGGASDNIRKSGTKLAEEYALTLLDQLFDGQARPLFEDAEVVHWTSHHQDRISDFIQGAFSVVPPYPVNARAILGAPLDSVVPPDPMNARAILGAPLDNKIYFAGEATHTRGLANTLHGAAETAQRAVHELLANV